MALPACFHLADEVFPRVRANAAHRLAAQGWSQVRIGKALGLSQAMVSKHLASKPRSDPLVDHLTEELVADLEAPVAASGPSAWCATLSVGRGPDGDAALRDLLAAERDLVSRPPVRLLPQIGLNLARAVAGAKAPGEVLAFPGRLVEAGGQLLRPAAPTFGGSSHLAKLLLAHPRAAALSAVANVRGGSDVAAAVRKLGWPRAEVARNGKSSDPDAAVLRAISSSPAATAVHDPGAVGLEPCLYLFGADARAVAASIQRLHDTLVNP